jgi:hypothetical protein
VDDITNVILEVRRHKKNVSLFKDEESLQEMQEYLSALKKDMYAAGIFESDKKCCGIH